MTADLKPARGRVFVGYIWGDLKLLTVKSVRHRKDGTPSSCVLTYENDLVRAEAKITLPESGELTGFRRVTLSGIGTAKDVAARVGTEVPTDAVVIVTHDRVGSDKVLADG